MALGLVGAHRTGKSTLAREFAKEKDIPFLATTASAVFKSMGLDPAQQYPFDVRLEVQERILATFCDQYRSMSGRFFITDRTPIDMIAYTLAEVGPTTLTPELEKRLEKYVHACYKATNDFFSLLVIVQPGIEVVEEEGKASLSPMYIEHVAHLVMGVTASESIKTQHFFIPRHVTAIEDRVKCVSSALNRTLNRQVELVREAKERGTPITVH